MPQTAPADPAAQHTPLAVLFDGFGKLRPICPDARCCLDEHLVTSSSVGWCFVCTGRTERRTIRFCFSWTDGRLIAFDHLKQVAAAQT
jgi:hypothetical protein